MRKLLFFSVAACFGVTANAQQRVKVTSTQQHSKIEKVQQVDFKTSPVKSSASKVSAVGVNMGQGPNAYGPAFNPWTNVATNEDLNIVAFIHRSDAGTNGDNGSGSLRYDISTDGGSTFNNNVGPLWNPTSATGSPPGPGRYPQAGIINPSGNTTPSNAYMTFFAPTLSGHNGSWGGLLQGSTKLDGTGLATNLDTSNNTTGWFVVNEGYTVAGDKSFGLNFSQVGSGTGYTDSLMVMKGVWNGAAPGMAYSIDYIDQVFGTNSSGDPVFADARVAFSPDGMTGYITILGYSSSYPTYGIYHPMVLKTTDGGTTWSTSSNIVLDDLMEVEENDSLITIIRSVDSTWAIGNLSAAFEHDMIVDANGNPHLLMNICPAAVSTTPGGGSLGTEFSVFSGINAITDVYSTDGGATWKARIVGAPQTFRGGFGTDPSNPDISEDNRPQLSRSSDGKKVFYHWFDTDVSIWGGTDNNFPDAWVNGYDVMGDSIIAGPLNITNDINSSGTATFGNVGEVAFQEGTSDVYKTHIVIQQLDQTTNDVLDPTQYIYYAGYYPGNISVAEEDLEVNAFELGQNFPNPANDFTRVKMEVVVGGEYSVEIVNMVGQVMMTKDLGHLTMGTTVFEMNTSNLVPGVYFYTVKTNGAAVSKKMIIE